MIGSEGKNGASAFLDRGLDAVAAGEAHTRSLRLVFHTTPQELSRERALGANIKATNEDPMVGVIWRFAEYLPRPPRSMFYNRGDLARSHAHWLRECLIGQEHGRCGPRPRHHDAKVVRSERRSDDVTRLLRCFAKLTPLLTPQHVQFSLLTLVVVRFPLIFRCTRRLLTS